MPTFIDRTVYINEILSVDVERRSEIEANYTSQKHTTRRKVLIEGH